MHADTMNIEVHLAAISFYALDKEHTAATFFHCIRFFFFRFSFL